MQLLAAIFDAISAAGGTLALTFIVVLTLVAAALGFFYLGSAIVVLERFARVVRGGWAVAGFGILVSLGASALLVASPASDAGGGASAATVVSVSAVATLAAIAATWLLLRRLPPVWLARGVLAVAGLAAAVWIGAAARLDLAVAVPGAVLLLALAPVVQRRWSRLDARSSAPAGGAERELLWLVGALACAIPLAGALPVPHAGLAALGGRAIGWLLGAIVLGLLPLAAAGLVQMRSSVEWFIALRYLVAKRRQVFISAITAICVIGIAAGVWLIVVVLSVMNGFERTWRTEILGSRPHFTVHRRGEALEDHADILARVAAVPGVTGASPYLDAEGMVRVDRGEIFSVRVRGIDPEKAPSVTGLSSDVLVGSLAGLSDRAGAGGQPEPPGILIGNHLAISIGVGLGDDLLMISPYGGAPTPLGPAPRLQRFRVAGIYRSSFFQYDEVTTYVALGAAQEFRNVGDIVDGIEVRTTDFYRSQRVGDAVVAELGPSYFSRDWKEFFPAFFQALKTERVMMFLLLTMIMVVAALVIVATLIMMIMEKSGDIAILKAMGAEDGAIERIFAIEGTLIGVAGTLLGVIAALAVTHRLSWIQDRIESFTGIDALPSGVYQLSALPTEIDPIQIAAVAAIALVLSLGATLLPSHQGARLDPAEALRYE